MGGRRYGVPLELEALPQCPAQQGNGEEREGRLDRPCQDCGSGAGEQMCRQCSLAGGRCDRQSGEAEHGPAGSLVFASILAAKFVSPRLGLIAGGIGAGLTFSAATSSCAMGQALSVMPWNRSTSEPTTHQALQNLDARP